MVSGSTGWNNKLDAAKELCRQEGGAFLHASNFSIGVNIFFELNKTLARLLQPYPDYNVALTETHHTQKKDAPSGTAVTLAEQIIETGLKKTWTLDENAAPDALHITAVRQDPAPGTHTVTYSSLIDDIEITHTAHNRDGFALGAIAAAAFIHDKKGVFTMVDVLAG